MNRGYWVYILTNRYKGALYIGLTSDLGRRMYEHRNGLADGFTRTYGVTLLVHVEQYERLLDARAREHSLKRWRRAWKIALIERDNPDWLDLYDRLLA